MINVSLFTILEFSFYMSFTLLILYVLTGCLLIKLRSTTVLRILLVIFWLFIFIGTIILFFLPLALADGPDVINKCATVSPENTLQGLTNEAREYVNKNRPAVYGFLAAVGSMFLSYKHDRGAFVEACTAAAQNPISVCTAVMSATHAKDAVCHGCKRITDAGLEQINVFRINNYPNGFWGKPPGLANSLTSNGGEYWQNSLDSLFYFTMLVEWCLTHKFLAAIIIVLFIYVIAYYLHTYVDSFKKSVWLGLGLQYARIVGAVLCVALVGFGVAQLGLQVGVSVAYYSLFYTALAVVIRTGKKQVVAFLTKINVYSIMRNWLIFVFTYAQPFVYNLLTAGYIAGTVFGYTNNLVAASLGFGFAFKMAASYVSLPTVLFDLQGIRTVGELKNDSKSIKRKIVVDNTRKYSSAPGAVGSLPMNRYDQFMRIGLKALLILSLAFFGFYASFDWLVA